MQTNEEENTTHIRRSNLILDFNISIVDAQQVNYCDSLFRFLSCLYSFSMYSHMYFIFKFFPYILL